MDWLQTIIVVAAVWGTALSTYVLIRNLIKEKCRLKVKLRIGITSGDVFSLKAVNVGNRLVTLSSCGLSFTVSSLEDLPQENCFKLGKESNRLFPHKLFPGEKFTVYWEATDAGWDFVNSHPKSSLKVSGFFEDSFGKSHKSGSLKFKIPFFQRLRYSLSIW